MKLIILTLGYDAKVDDADFEELDKFTWTADVRSDGTIYARRNESGQKVYMHRQIAGVSDRHVLVDHKNHDTLDNQRHNLSSSNKSKNGQNRSGANITSLTGVRGVTLDLRTGRYRVQVTKDGKNHTFGRYDTLEEANEVAISARKRLFETE